MFLPKLYGMLLGLYPSEFRARFGGEMKAVFQQAAAGRRERGVASLSVFTIREFCGLLAGAAKERAFHPEPLRRGEPLPFPADIPGAERYIRTVSERLIHAIANHDFAGARFYDLEDRKARALLAQLRSQAG